ncbi:DUF3397 domain-containing protein [Paenibacillus sp. JX-17]|uniref:DUF3397 domain-containing protein n=1 Tax=Paenibacillus lacisoli TaxID=3064525 RepID=A0ABT9C845_9BACL|nr:DUF3397 domain-containing protein [Paenibacillus sp. JX-17]MDO7905421.1 DUF3397 domain-containing protein [Paenibacillus sp. JX-17]
MEFLKDSLIALSIAPFIPFCIVFFITDKITGQRKQAVKLAMDITTFFLIAVVAGLFNHLFHSSFGFYLILLLILIAFGLLGGAQNRMKGKVDFKRVIKAVWRISFLLTSMSYIVLIVIGIITYIFK